MKDLAKTLIIAGTILVTALALGIMYLNRNYAPGEVNVTGSAQVDFDSDLILRRGSFSRVDASLEKAFAALKRETERVRAFFAKNGIPETEIVFESVSIDKLFESRYSPEGNVTDSDFVGFELTQRFKVESKSAGLVEGVSRGIPELITDGLEIYSEPPEYFYTAIADLKLKLIAEATRDARARAEQMAQNFGSTLGRALGIDMGVFQIIETNSSESQSWGGTLNTRSRRKTATITARVGFKLK